MTKFALALACLISTTPLVRAQAPSPDPWAPLRFLVGEWQGPVSGELGTGTVTRRYRFILSGSFLQERSMANYPPQALHPDGSVYTQASFMVHDRLRKALLFRIFSQDPFNGVFALAPQDRPTRLVFESEQLDGAAATWRARRILEVASPDEFVEILEVAEGGKPFAVRSRIPFKRKRS